MAVTQSMPAVAAAEAPVIPVRTITAQDLRQSLDDGLRDFGAMRGDLLFIGLLYPLIGVVAAVVSLGGSLMPLFFPIAAGVSMLGPLAAIGFYELARRREEGLESDWSHYLDVRKRPSFDAIMVVSGLLLVLFLAWVAVAAALYAALMGNAPGSVGEFLTRVFTTPEGWTMIILGNLIGLGFAIIVLAVSVVSLPMLVDRDLDASTAIATSIRAVKGNKGVMMRWGVTVAVLLVLGSIPVFIGLAFVLPWLGYATWHLYTRLVDRTAIPISMPR